jgi:hypothetical protein
MSLAMKKTIKVKGEELEYNIIDVNDSEATHLGRHGLCAVCTKKSKVKAYVKVSKHRHFTEYYYLCEECYKPNHQPMFDLFYGVEYK